MKDWWVHNKDAILKKQYARATWLTIYRLKNKTAECQIRRALRMA